MSEATLPFTSVIVPAHRCAELLKRSLPALHASSLARKNWELIVVDDASGDETVTVASSLADRVVQLAGRAAGPALARNRGAEVARGELLVFVDADVLVHRDTLEKLIRVLNDNADVAAVFGSYDEQPAASGTVSRYRNLMHHYVHTINAGEAETFWAGCGAVRRSVFERVGGFDERRYPRPQIEDIELGHRIRDLGVRILLRPEIQCTHLKRWTLRSMVVADIRHRGVPWVELLLEERGGSRTSTLNLQFSEKLYTLLTALALASLFVSLVTAESRWAWLAGLLIGATLLGNARLLKWFAVRHGFGIALIAMPLRLLHYVINGVSIVWGGARYILRRSKGPRDARRLPIARSPEVAQVGANANATRGASHHAS